MPLLSPSAVSFMTQSIPRQKRKGDSMHPCFTPVLISRSSDRYWPQMSLVLKSPYSSLIMLTILGGFHSAGVYARESLSECCRKPFQNRQSLRRMACSIPGTAPGSALR